MASPDEGPRGAEGPEWADEDHLDDVFSTWVPGPHESAPAAEREMAGDNPRLEIPAEEAVPDQDMEAALAAALAEAEGVTGSPPDRAEEAGAGSPAESRSEPSGPSWLRIDAPEPPAAVAPDPGPEPAPAPAPRIDPDPDPEFEPDADLEPEPGAGPEQDLAAPPAAPPAPRPEPAKPARPWTRSDDDILPGRGGKGRRR